MTTFPYFSPICTVVSLTLGSTAFHNEKNRQKRKSLLLPAFSTHFHSGRQDLNLRPLDPQSSTLAKLRHAPNLLSSSRPHVATSTTYAW